ncbi:hypothetical protein RFI_18630 [Reticulomyxa filosa]|uniref:Uncharacterized protein n=1 Tax=Reticulomyxa filosa TaxID=46433 RepID=X6MX82_RETFI|nr:hypothetical protein RFI_18630 [Reticulomyxa filosa]|eukprot:ETO18635.1 hypothetical protein RFI_18630 [Reticulomyxa filosa]
MYLLLPNVGPRKNDTITKCITPLFFVRLKQRINTFWKIYQKKNKINQQKHTTKIILNFRKVKIIEKDTQKKKNGTDSFFFYSRLVWVDMFQQKGKTPLSPSLRKENKELISEKTESRWYCPLFSPDLLLWRQQGHKKKKGNTNNRNLIQQAFFPFFFLI